MKTQMKKYSTGGAKPKAKTAAELKAEGLEMKKKGEAMKKAGSSNTSYKVDPKYKDISSFGSTKAFNPKNNTLTTVSKSAADPRYTKDVKVQKFTTGKSSYKEVATGAGAYYKPTKIVYNPKNNTKTTINYKNVNGEEVKQIKVTKLTVAASKPEVKKKTTPVVPTPAPVKTPPKKVEAKKVEAKKSSSTTSKSTESPVSPVLSAAIAKSNPTAPKISSETRSMMDNLSKSSSTSASTKQKFGARVKAKVAEAVTNRRQKRLTKLKSKLGQMKMGGTKKYQNGGTASSSFKGLFNIDPITPKERQVIDARDKKRLETVKKRGEQIKTSELKSRTPGISYYENSIGKRNISKTGTVTETRKFKNGTGTIVTPKKGDVQYTKLSMPSKKSTTTIYTVDKPSQFRNPNRKTNKVKIITSNKKK